MIVVKSTLPDNRVALWDRHPDHPDGEVFVAGERKVTVAETPQVKAAIKAGRVKVLRRFSSKPAKSQTKPKEEETEPKEEGK